MKRHNRRTNPLHDSIRTLAAFAAVLLGIPPAFAEAETNARVLATVAGNPLTVSEFFQEIERHDPHAVASMSAEQRRDLLKALIRERTLAWTARQAGYAEHPEVLAIAEQAMVEKFKKERLDALLAEVSVSDEEIEGHYLAHQEEYTAPEKVRAALILIAIPTRATEEVIKNLEKRALAVHDEAVAADDAGFAALARHHSDASNRYAGGNIGWIHRGGRPLKWGEETVNALFALQEAGEVAPLIRTESGFYIARLLERKARKLRPLKQFRTGIEHQLVKERRDQVREQFYREIEREAETVIYGEILDSLELPQYDNTQRRLPPPVPGS